MTPSAHRVVFALDAHSANATERTGVHNYAFHLIQAMKNHPLKEEERVVLYSYEPLRDELAILPTGWSSQVLAWPPRFGWMSVRVAWQLLRDRPNVFFVPAQAIPFTSTPVVTTIHDVAAQIVPEVFAPADRKRLLSKTRRAVKHARALLAVSEATKQDIMRIHGVSQERIHVTPLAADTTVYQPQSPESIRAVQQTYRVGNHFFLSVGRLEKKKNLSTLIRAFDVFKRNRGSGDPYELVLVGTPGTGYAEIHAYIQASPFRDQIRTLGYLKDHEVACLMSAATAYIFPSWFEGFGIPNLEAMACGTPLITSDLPAHREVVGDAGILIKPGDGDAWARAMTRMTQDPIERQRLIDLGFQHVQAYSWSRTAERTWAVLRNLI